MPEKPASDLVHIRLHPQGTTLHVPRGTPLQEILFEYGVNSLAAGTGAARLQGQDPDGDAPWTRGRKRCCPPPNWPMGGALHAAAAHQEMSPWRSGSGKRRYWRIILPSSSGRGKASESPSTWDHDARSPAPGPRHGDVLAVRTGLNPQAAYGGDVMSRIQYALSPGGQPRLEKLIRSGIGDLILGLLEAAGRGRKSATS